MQQALHRSSLVPRGFVVESACYEGDKAVITVRGSGSVGICPSCGAASRRVHSRYRRRVTDLPLSGRVVKLLVIARRFRCDSVLCGRQIFTERFAEGILAPSARRTARLDSIVHHLGLALGGRPAAGFAKRLMLPVSKDTLLRVVRRRHRPPADPLKVIGIDDWAWRRNHRYASIICNLERRRVVTLLPDREPATARAWLAAHPTIAIVARDRGGGYGEAAAKALPHAVQVADRWHLMENASRAFLDAVRKSMRQIRTVIGATTIDPQLLTAAERLQYVGYLRREETNAAILALSKNGIPIKQIVRQTGYSRKLVRQVIRGERTDVFRTRQSSLDLHLPWLDDQWVSGCRNGAELWRRLAARGFRGSLRVVSEWATRRRQAEKADAQNLHRIPSARTIARLMTIGRDQLTKAETVTVAAIEAGVPTLVEAREIIAEFHLMIRRKTEAGFIPWIGRARASLVASFASGVAKDEAAVRAAITSPWSNGQTEGQITRLKLVRRQMYGRGKIDLLQARLIGAE
ncbi:ISL3 family transposase [Bradyrhizobium sp. 76]|uniref:ISL3 family transposase n=1 Tax=Bradyrhizobium sp. 76 TaxID=2782680 RepID=UPI001FF8F1C6|nr:ISL3 family transposase [Bradyrhizobium sp. 76]MCK1410198.1 ISL3 family transposase [Bradyrhizobium sp. 76]